MLHGNALRRCIPCSTRFPISGAIGARSGFRVVAPLLCVAFSAFIVGIVRVGSASGGGSIGQTNESNMIGLLAASVALLATWRFLYERVTLMRLYQILFPLTATAFLLLPLLEGTFRQVVYSLVFLVFSVTSSLMVVSCARTARQPIAHSRARVRTFASIVYASSAGGFRRGACSVGGGRGVGLRSCPWWHWWRCTRCR